MRDKAASKRGIFIVIVLFVAMFVYAIYVAGIPRLLGKALSTSQPYTSPSTSITAQVDSDTALNVTEQRTFTFSGKTTCVRWKHDALTDKSTISMHGLRVSVLDANGDAIESTELQTVPFETKWRETDGTDGIGPNHACYSIDESNNTVYTFFEAEGETVVLTLDYTVENGVQVWKDVAELNWTVLSSNWEIDSDNLTVSFQLPVATNALVSPGKNVNAWSHGPQNGTIAVTESGVVLYEVSKASSGQYAFLHVTFPSVWITNLPDTAFAHTYTNEVHLDTAIAAEKKWIDSNNAAQVRGDKFDIAALVFCLVVLAVAVILFLRFGRDPKPCEANAAAAQEAIAATHPAILDRLMRWNRQDERQFAISIARLAQKNLISIEKIDDNNPTDGDNPTGWENPINEGNPTYRLSKTSATADDEMDKATVAALFEGLPDDPSSITVKDIASCAANNKDAFCETIAVWNHKLDHRVDDLALFDKKSFSWQIRLFVVAALLLLVGICAKAFAGSDVLLGASLPTVCIIALLANYMPRRTQVGQDMAACIVARELEHIGDEHTDDELDELDELDEFREAITTALTTPTKS